MLNVVEMFSGIGSQAKALERQGIEHEILATCDWDINAIIAYDIIHNGQQDLDYFLSLDENEIDKQILRLSISANGKVALDENAKRRLKFETKLRLLSAIQRTNNLIDITRVTAKDIPGNCNVLTYSFPCQDLSNAGFWQGNDGGINRNANNRSSLLWQIERILLQKRERNANLPRFLLMENVSAIQSQRNISNFNEWKNILFELGYENKVLDLDAVNFGVPQHRTRTFMISVYCGVNIRRRRYVTNLFEQITEENFPNYFQIHRFTMQDVLRQNYQIETYLTEARESNPNDTVSRRKIREETPFIDVNTEFVPTVTTKQDRFPNSGLIEFDLGFEGKSDFRYLTPRECFMLMGFDEFDFEQLLNNNFNTGRSHFFTRDKLNRMAGNSICVNVLEHIFRLIDEIDEHIRVNEI
ncbi:MAG: DNA cytosine methyltransferase [Erysipelotrichaceae bacterium]|uniref:DNA cytosine methyltransferase n=1 Tax=Anaerorhabdus sp. TaxID=1872524 RepID=UPI002FC9AA18